MLEHTEWVSQPANAAWFAPHLRTAPLAGVPKKPMLFQFAKGDQTVPNPTATAVLRAGHFADRATYFRNDLAFAADPTVPKNPHSFLTRIAVPSVAASLRTQRQIATFLASDGTVIVDPDGAGPLLEVPIAGPLPRTCRSSPRPYRRPAGSLRPGVSASAARRGTRAPARRPRSRWRATCRRAG